MRYLRKFNENFDGEKHYTKELFNAVESGDINKVKELLESELIQMMKRKEL